VTGAVASRGLRCTSASDTSENDAAYVCDDGLDNDGETLLDFPFDTSSATATGTNGAPTPPPGGSGPELAALLPLLAWARRRRHAPSRLA
jgi:hypothetical protein